MLKNKIFPECQGVFSLIWVPVGGGGGVGWGISESGDWGMGGPQSRTRWHPCVKVF